MFDMILNNGVKMPVLGLGVYKTKEAAEMQTAVDSSLDAGYRSFDTAQLYGNEDLLGEAIQHNGVAREKIFLTSKVHMSMMGYDRTIQSFEESLEKLRTDYLDLFLIHWPGQKKERLQDTWRALEYLYDGKRVRAIGVCNCTQRHLEWILEQCVTAPSVNQIERHPLLNQRELYEWCVSHDIQPEAWAPLIRGSFDLPELAGLAAKYGKTPAQIILRWDVQSGYVVIPKSVNRGRIFENADVFDFRLDEADMKLLDGLDTGYTTGWDLDTYDY